MQLEQRLVRAEFRERLARRIVVGAILVAAITFPVLASQVLGSPDPWDKSATPLSVALGVTYFAACAVAALGLAACYTRFVPRVNRSRDELREASLEDLRREVQELRRLVESRLPPQRHQE